MTQELRTFHFDLSYIQGHADMKELTLVARGKKYALQKHDAASIEKFAATNPLLKLLPADRVTHFAEEVACHTERPMLIHVTTPKELNGHTVAHILHMHVHVPDEGHRLAKPYIEETLAGHAVHPKLHRYGLTRTNLAKVGRDPLDPTNSPSDPSDCAAALMFHNHQIMYVGGTPGGSQYTQMVLTDCHKYNQQLVGAIVGWAGGQWLQPMPGVQNPLITADGRKIPRYTLNPTVAQAAGPAISQVITASRQNTAYKGKLWDYRLGQGASTYNATPSGYFEAKPDTQGDSSGVQWQRKYFSGERGLTVDSSVGWDGVNVSINCTNYYNRHLGVYVQFLDSAGNPLNASQIGWQDRLTGLPFLEPNATKRWVNWVTPITEYCGIPASPDPTTLSFMVPEQAASFKLYWGGIGLGNYDGDVCWPGIGLTAFFEIAIPTLCLVADVADALQKTIDDLLKDHQFFQKLFELIGKVMAGYSGINDLLTSSGLVDLLKSLAADFGPMLANPLLDSLIAAMFSAQAAEDAIPLVDIAFAAAAAAMDLSLLAQTITEVLMSPPVFTSEFCRTTDLTVTISPDPARHRFPPQAVTYKVWGQYDSKATVAAQEFQLSGEPASLAVTFRGLPAGGKIQMAAILYSSDGWVTSAGQSDPQDAFTGSALSASITLKDNPVPLNANSIYQHAQKLAYNGTYTWQQTSTPPSATQYGGSSVPNGVKITNAQKPGFAAYAWQNPDTNQYMANNIFMGLSPQTGFQSASGGNTARNGVSYDVASSSDGGGRNYYVDGNNNVYHVSLYYEKSGPLQGALLTNLGESWTLADLAVHSQGVLFGVSSIHHKLLRCELNLFKGTAPPAPTFFGGQGSRVGLLNNPIAVGINLDGVVFVLEAGNNRIQVFDICGNPTPHFNGQATLSLPGGRNYLDMAVESKGYIYILYTNGAGYSASAYCMDILKPDGSFLVTTQGIAASKITVDMFRDVFTLNYERITGQSGTEPSVSMWYPPTP